MAIERTASGYRPYRCRQMKSGVSPSRQSSSRNVKSSAKLDGIEGISESSKKASNINENRSDPSSGSRKTPPIKSKDNRLGSRMESHNANDSVSNSLGG